MFRICFVLCISVCFTAEKNKYWCYWANVDDDEKFDDDGDDGDEDDEYGDDVDFVDNVMVMMMVMCPKSAKNNFAW